MDQAILDGCASRAAGYDRDNRFFFEDFEALKEVGYLNMPVPKELGGGGMSLAEVCREQRRLAYHAPPTALAVNMHLYWVGIAADLWRAGDTSLEWMLKESVEGEVFAAGHSEAGNDLPILLSTAKAERVEGGYRFTGRKHFGSLSPVWTRLGIHATDADHEGGPHVVHAFLPRDAEGYRIEETWDTMSMRATRSDDTVLEGAFVPDHYIGRKVPAMGVDAFVLSLFAWALLGFAHIYHGLAQRAVDVVLPGLGKKTSLGLTRPMAYHPHVQHSVAEMALELAPIGPHIERVAEDWSNGVDHGATWAARIVGAKYHAVEAGWRVVDGAMDVSGGSGMFRGNELERLFRDARAGRFHPANSALCHEIVGKTALGIDLGELPRWG